MCQTQIDNSLNRLCVELGSKHAELIPHSSFDPVGGGVQYSGAGLRGWSRKRTKRDLVVMHRQVFHLLVDYAAGACQSKINPAAIRLDQLVPFRIVSISTRNCNVRNVHKFADLAR